MHRAPTNLPDVDKFSKEKCLFVFSLRAMRYANIESFGRGDEKLYWGI
jgi:hypothetical protein